MRNDRISLIDFAGSFLAERDVSHAYRVHLLLTCALLERWAGRRIYIDDLSCDLLNRWLVHLQGRGLSPYSVRTYRGNILALWNSAYLDRLNDEPPLRLRRIKKRARLVEAYTLEEIGKLLTATVRLRGTDRNGNRRSAFWRKLLLTAYSTGLRRGDLLVIFESAIAPDGTYRTIQRKTGKPITVRISTEAMKIKLHCPNGLFLPWPNRLDALAWAFRRLRKMAGVTRGSLKWVRRSAGSHAERERPGDGPRLLGHSPDVFWASYGDRTIIGQQPVSPPPLRIE